MADFEPNNPLPGENDHLSRLLPTEVEEPFYKTFFRDLKETIFPPKLPPLEVTSRPVAVKDIWGLYGNQKKSFAMSFGFQIALIAIVVFALSTKPVQKVVKNTVAVFLDRKSVV